MALPAGPVVVLTREPEDNAPLSKALAERGVPVLEIPCLATRFTEPAALPTDVQAVAFTSRRGVAGFIKLDGYARVLERSPLIAAVGPATSRSLAAAGLRADIVAEPPRGDVLARLLREQLSRGARVAVVRGNLRAGGLDAALAAAGFELLPVVVYENIEPEIPEFPPREVAAVLVASPSAGQRLLAANPWLKQAEFLCIGDTTVAALRAAGVRSARVVRGSPAEWVETLDAAFRNVVESVTQEPTEER